MKYFKSLAICALLAVDRESVNAAKLMQLSADKGIFGDAQSTYVQERKH